jgi:hypothetical protein
MPVRPSARRARLAAALLAATCWSLGAAGPAAAMPVAAEPPQNLPGPVTDLAGVLSPSQEREVEDALDDLAAATPYQLFVVYVDTFDGMSNRAWTDDTADLSGFGRDDILLAVAVDDRRYQVSVEEDIELSDADLATVERDAIEPALGDDDWAGAAVAAAAGYERAVNPPASAGVVVVRVLLALGAVGLLGYAGYRLVHRRRAAARAAAELDALVDRSASALVAADEAVAAAAQEVGFTEAQLGAAHVAPVAAAVAEARTVLADAFRARQELDDEVPDSDSRRSALAYAVLDGCTRVEAILAAQRETVDRLRALHERAPQDLAAARDEAAALTTRARDTGTTWEALRRGYAPTAMADVPAAVADAVELATRATGEAEAGLAVLDTDRAAAVAHAEEARAALTRATVVLDALDQQATDLATAPQQIEAVRAEIDADLVDAARLGDGTGPVQEAAGVARRAQDRAVSADAELDPLAVLTALREAEAGLDQVLDPLRATEAARQHALERLPQVQATVRARIAAAEATIARDRWSVGATARTRLAEAQRLAVAGDVAVSTDPVAALNALRAAATRADEAQRSALADVDLAVRRRAASYDDGPSWTSSSSRRSGSGFSFGSGSSSRRSGSSSRRSSSSGRSGGARRSGGSSRRGGGGRF